MLCFGLFYFTEYTDGDEERDSLMGNTEEDEEWEGEFL